MKVPPAVQNGRRKQERADERLVDARRFRHARACRAPAARSRRTRHPRTPTDVSTLKANRPLTSGARSSRKCGRRCSSTSFSTFCTQKPADEIVNSFHGVSPLGWVMAKNGIPWKSTFLSSGVCPSARSATT